MTEVVRAALAQQFGLSLRTQRLASLDAAVARVGKRLSLQPHETADRIVRDRGLLQEVAEGVLVNESHFFRHRRQLEAACDFAAGRIQQGKRIRIWSAGCARGEEPYSVRALLGDRLSASELDRVEVWGTDLDRGSMDRAARGRYEAWSLRGVTDLERRRHFDEDASGSFRLKPHLMGTVRFMPGTIQSQMSTMGGGSLDLILFRNVGIYLTSDTWRDVVRRMADLLTLGGWLVTAPTDPDVEDRSRLQRRDVGVYARDDGNASSRRRSSAPPSSRRRLRSKRSPAPPPSASQDATVAKARSLADAGDLAGAVTALDRVLASAPDHRGARHARAQVRLADARFDAALRDLDRLARTQGGDALARFYRALCHASLGDAARACGQLRELEALLVDPPANTYVGDYGTRELLDATRSELRRLT